MRKFKAGIIGATGMVGQRFVSLLSKHPWFEISHLSASARSAGKTYEEAVKGRWTMEIPLPANAAAMTVFDAEDISAASGLDFVFCAISLEKELTKQLEEAYAKADIPVVSNNSAHRETPDVPMLMPEVNAGHIDVIEYQRKRLGTNRGFIAVKPNCSIQTFVPALHPLYDFGIEQIAVCTYQAISGAGKTFESWPEMVDNVIPYIGGEEQKSEREPLKIWGQVDGGVIVNAQKPVISSQCIRVPVSDGHMAATYVKFSKKPPADEIIERWRGYKSLPLQLALPSAPKQFLIYHKDDARPQTRLDRDSGGGMSVSIGRLREDCIFDYKFVCLSHNTLRGAAGGGLLTAELLAAKGYFDR
ncbi:MAG: aspartate-semialdehyde dehydrogenase [Christensenellales bacterium]